MVIVVNIEEKIQLILFSTKIILIVFKETNF